MQRKILDLPAASVVLAFYLSVRSISIIEKLAARWVHTVAELYSLAYKCARAEEAGVPSGAVRCRRRVRKRNSSTMKVTLSEDGTRTVNVDD